MNPKKIKPLIKKYCEINNVDQQLLEKLVDTYWKRVKKALTEPEHINVYVEGFGTFSIKQNRLAKRVKSTKEIVNKYQSIIDSGHRITMQKYAILHEKKKALEKLEKMYPLFEEKKEYKINAKKERDEYKRNLEEQIKNSGGNKELSDQE